MRRVASRWFITIYIYDARNHKYETILVTKLDTVFKRRVVYDCDYQYTFPPHFSCFQSSTHILYFRNQLFPVWNHPILRLFFRPLEEFQTANDSKYDIPLTEF